MKTAAVVILGLFLVAADQGQNREEASPPASPAQEQSEGQRLASTLSGAAVVPISGDPDGRGTATLELNASRLEVCFGLTVSSISPATAAHVHAGAAGTAGAVVITLTPAPAEGASAGCAGADADLIKAILENPAGYYVNIANADYPNGALRGQLSR